MHCTRHTRTHTAFLLRRHTRRNFNKAHPLSLERPAGAVDAAVAVAAAVAAAGVVAKVADVAFAEVLLRPREQVLAFKVWPHFQQKHYTCDELLE